MSSLFGNLPAPERQAEESPSKKRARPDEAGPDPTSAPGDVAREDVAEDIHRQEPAAGPSPTQEQGVSLEDGAAAAAPAPTPPKIDGAALAIVRIGNHISQPAKFAKASRLLRQLMEQVRGGFRGGEGGRRSWGQRNGADTAPAFLVPDGMHGALEAPPLPILAFLTAATPMGPRRRGRIS